MNGVHWASSIEAKGLTKAFGERCALDHLDLQIPYQSIFGLLGDDGAGKSTAIKILTTVLEASSGSAQVAGFDVATDPQEVRRRIGFVQQVPEVNGALTGTENLVLSADLHGLRGVKRDVRIHDALNFAGLKSVAGHQVKTYSAGIAPRCCFWTSPPWGWIPSPSAPSGNGCWN